MIVRELVRVNAINGSMVVKLQRSHIMRMIAMMDVLRRNIRRSIMSRLVRTPRDAREHQRNKQNEEGKA